MWVYLDSEPGLFTVGFYRPDGSWVPESDHDSRESAAARVSYLNGNRPEPTKRDKGQVGHAVGRA